MKHVTFSIGIPLFNEEKTIHSLLLSLLAQKDVVIKEIILAVDGSTDTTLREITRIEDSRIRILKGKKRLGKAYRMQEILNVFSSEALVFMDGDVSIQDTHLLSSIAKRIDFTKIHIVGLHTKPEVPVTILQKILFSSMIFIDSIKKSWNNGDNYLSFKGNMLVLSKRFAQSITFPEKLVNDDAYLYFKAKQLHLKTAYIPDLHVFYTLPLTVSDHMKQAFRFYKSKNELTKYFPKSLLSYAIPRRLVCKGVLITLLITHIYFLCYLCMRVLSLVNHRNVLNATWNIAKTTKGVRYG